MITLTNYFNQICVAFCVAFLTEIMQHIQQRCKNVYSSESLWKTPQPIEISTMCRCSLVAKHQLPKLGLRVRLIPTLQYFQGFSPLLLHNLLHLLFFSISANYASKRNAYCYAYNKSKYHFEFSLLVCVPK